MLFTKWTNFIFLLNGVENWIHGDTSDQLASLKGLWPTPNSMKERLT